MVLALITPVLEDAAESTASSAPTTIASERHSGRGAAVPVQGVRIPAGFLGVSLEFSAIRAYAGENASVNPLLVQLIRNLAPGQTPVLRIGGNSTDWTWWPVPGVTRPASVGYRLTPAWLRTTSALGRALGARMILGINLAMNRPRLAAAEAQALSAGIGRSSVAALEIGNESDVYRSFPRYRDATGRLVHVRRRTYNFPEFTREFARVGRALTSMPIAGPAFGNLTWMSRLHRFLVLEPRLGLVTFHRYPLSCFAGRASPRYPSIGNLLNERASHGLAEDVAPLVELAHARGLRFRLDELNSVACAGRRGVSDTFASALWSLDTLFELARVGVDGVNIHTLPGAAYQPFSFTHRSGRWEAIVRPEYYGLLMFAKAAPPGSRLLAIGDQAGGRVKRWATIAPDHTTRLVLINKGDTSSPVTLRAPAAIRAATVERLMAPSLAARSGVTLGGQSFGPVTETGAVWGPRSTTTIHSIYGMFETTLPPASATMLTMCQSGCKSPLL